MYVRLAFAVAAHLEPEILLVDEVLAVGDAEFQRKSLGKMSEVAKGGRTVLFVSHNLGAIRRLCSHAFVLESGKIAFGGNVDAALTAYERLYRSSGRSIASASFTGPLAEQIQFDQVICRQGGVVVSELNPQRELEIEVHYFALRPFPTFDLQIALFRTDFILLHATIRSTNRHCAPAISFPDLISLQISSNRAYILWGLARGHRMVPLGLGFRCRCVGLSGKLGRRACRSQ